MKVSVCRNGMQLLRLALCRARPRSRSCLQWAIYSSSSSSSSPRDNGPINKDVVARQMTEQLYGYLLQHTREPEVRAGGAGWAAAGRPRRGGSGAGLLRPAFL